MIKEEAFRIIEERNKSARKLAEENYASALEDPAFFKADREVRRLTINIARLKSENKNTAEAELELKLSEKEKILALKNLGMSPASVKPHYICKICSDSGFAGGSFCACIQKINNEILAKSSGMSSLPKADFADFSPELYPAGKQRDEITKLYAKMQDYCNKFPDSKYRSILLIGATGLGKTQLICSIANELIKKGENVLYLTAFGLNNIMLKAHTTFDNTREHILDEVLNCSLLVIDDLGTEPVYKNVTEDYLLAIINERMLNARHTLISTNLPLNALNTRYGTRLVSRLTDKSRSFSYVLTGEDVRLQKKR